MYLIYHPPLVQPPSFPLPPPLPYPISPLPLFLSLPLPSFLHPPSFPFLFTPPFPFLPSFLLFTYSFLLPTFETQSTRTQTLPPYPTLPYHLYLYPTHTPTPSFPRLHRWAPSFSSSYPFLPLSFSWKSQMMGLESVEVGVGCL